MTVKIFFYATAYLKYHYRDNTRVNLSKIYPCLIIIEPCSWYLYSYLITERLCSCYMYPYLIAVELRSWFLYPCHQCGTVQLLCVSLSHQCGTRHPPPPGQVGWQAPSVRQLWSVFVGLSLYLHRGTVQLVLVSLPDHYGTVQLFTVEL